MSCLHLLCYCLPEYHCCSIKLMIFINFIYIIYFILEVHLTVYYIFMLFMVYISIIIILSSIVIS